MVEVTRSHIYERPPSKMADIAAIAPSASAVDGANQVAIDVQQLFAIVQQLSENLCLESACNNDL